MSKIDEKYYINVRELMVYDTPRCNLPRPTLKRKSIFVTGWNEWLQIKGVDTEI